MRYSVSSVETETGEKMQGLIKQGLQSCADEVQVGAGRRKIQVTGLGTGLTAATAGFSR